VLANNISGSGAVTLTLGALNLSGNSSYTGNTTIGGVAELFVGSNTNPLGSGILVFNNASAVLAP
jgi:hypothetical protein